MIYHTLDYGRLEDVICVSEILPYRTPKSLLLTGISQDYIYFITLQKIWDYQLLNTCNLVTCHMCDWNLQLLSTPSNSCHRNCTTKNHCQRLPLAMTPSGQALLSTHSVSSSLPHSAHCTTQHWGKRREKWRKGREPWKAGGSGEEEEPSMFSQGSLTLSSSQFWWEGLIFGDYQNY